jgi:hypothetical protein
LEPVFLYALPLRRDGRRSLPDCAIKAGGNTRQIGDGKIAVAVRIRAIGEDALPDDRRVRLVAICARLVVMLAIGIKRYRQPLD